MVGAITPWNFPHQINLAKVGPALAAGNTVVLKPAPDTPWCAAAVGRLIAEHTDIPAGVLNVVTSSDHDVGALLSTDPRVDMVSFTGSTATGRAVMADGAATLKKVFLELGGKSAFSCSTTPTSQARARAAFTASIHAGQGCAITTRLVVPRARYDEAVEVGGRDHGRAQAGRPDGSRHDLRAGDLGAAARPGAGLPRLGRRGGRHDSPPAVGVPPTGTPGFWIEPTVIAGLDNTARVAREEIFGPVLDVIPHDGDDDAVRIANDSPYGLSGSVARADPERAAGVAARIRTGTVAVNGGVWFAPDAPFGGYKQSGIGREMGVAGFEEYLETKTSPLRLSSAERDSGARISSS